MVETVMADQVRTLDNPKWIRGVHAGVTVVDSRRATFVWEHRYYPQWYFPAEDVAGRLEPNGDTFDGGDLGVGERLDLAVGNVVVPNAAWRHPAAPDGALRELVRFEFDALDSWFEEDVEVFVHPRSPEVRIDVLPSSRHVAVEVAGDRVAESRSSRILYETGLPPRYYLPKVDIRMDLLTPTDTITACPYKGWAQYWDVTAGGKVHSDLAWGYRTPLPESTEVAGLVCFYNEKVDLIVDGESAGRPVTKFS